MAKQYVCAVCRHAKKKAFVAPDTKKGVRDMELHLREKHQQVWRGKK